MQFTLWSLRATLCLLVLPLAASCSSGSAQNPPAPASSSAGAPAGSPDCQYVQSGSPAKPVKPPKSTVVRKSGSVTFVLKTTEGDVAITMNRAKAPCTVNSFESLVEQRYFDATRCHRLTDSGIFVLQCGDPTGTGSGGPGYTFADETTGEESYRAGVVAMANGGPGTNGSQFFLVWDDSTSLDATPNYTIFGQLDATSRENVAKMAREGQDGSNPAGGGKPNNPAEIISVTTKV